MPTPTPDAGAADSSLTRGGALVYAATPIRQRAEMLSLTDMWRAAGSDDARQPAEWLRSADALRFIGFLVETHNLGNSQVIASKPGKGGSTFAHWQIGLAYAKYLSPEFHVWCNTVVRERMEGRAPAPSLTAAQVGGITKAEFNRALAEIREEMRDVLAGFDPARAVAVEYRPMLDVVADLGVAPKGRRALVQRCSRLCSRWLIAAGRGGEMRISRETKRLLFHVTAAADWLAAEGRTVVAAHRDRIAGQTVMQFRPRPHPVPPPAETPTP